MTHPLVEVSRTRSGTTCSLIYKDYNKQPALCRSGIWVGLRCEFVETVVLSYEHDPEVLYVGWSINGTTVVDPGNSSGTPPGGDPVPGTPSLTYNCPVGGGDQFHQISLASTPGSDEECPLVQVLYRYPDPSQAHLPPHLGPSMNACLSGSEVTWPAANLNATRACLEEFDAILQRYVGPGDPVERWLERLQGEDAVRVRVLLEAVERIDQNAERELFEAIRVELRSIVTVARTPETSHVAPASVSISRNGDL